MYHDEAMRTTAENFHPSPLPEEGAARPQSPADHAAGLAGRQRAHVRRAGRFLVERPLAQVFPLFTPLGEKLWAPGWDPELHFPPDGAPCAGAVFSTLGEDELRTHWVTVDWEPDRHRARYARITPERRAGTVEVTCVEAGEGATVVEVTYDLAALSAAGDEELAAWTEEWYASYLEAWRRRIAGCLAAGEAARGDGSRRVEVSCREGA